MAVWSISFGLIYCIVCPFLLVARTILDGGLTDPPGVLRAASGCAA